MQHIVHYRRQGACLNFEFNGYVQTYMYYSLRIAYKMFKELCGIHRAKLVQDNAAITYGMLY